MGRGFSEQGVGRGQGLQSQTGINQMYSRRIEINVLSRRNNYLITNMDIKIIKYSISPIYS